MSYQFIAKFVQNFAKPHVHMLGVAWRDFLRYTVGIFVRHTQALLDTSFTVPRSVSKLHSYDPTNYILCLNPVGYWSISVQTPTSYACRCVRVSFINVLCQKFLGQILCIHNAIHNVHEFHPMLTLHSSHLHNSQLLWVHMKRLNDSVRPYRPKPARTFSHVRITYKHFDPLYH